MAILANLAPIVLLPLFYRVKPLDRDALRRRLMALADRAGARVLGAYEWGLGDKTKKANAALAGLGTTRRILVSDTMLADYSDEEIRAYVETGDPLDKAGAYAVQHPGFHPVKSMSGCHANVMGLPMCSVIMMMKKMDIQPNTSVFGLCEISLGNECAVAEAILRGEI